MRPASHGKTPESSAPSAAPHLEPPANPEITDIEKLAYRKYADCCRNLWKCEPPSFEEWKRESIKLFGGRVPTGFEQF